MYNSTQLCLGTVIQKAQAEERRREGPAATTWDPTWLAIRVATEACVLPGDTRPAPGKPSGETAPSARGLELEKCSWVPHHNPELQTASKAQDLLRLIWPPNLITSCDSSCVLLQNINVFNYKALPQALLWVLCN